MNEVLLRGNNDIHFIITVNSDYQTTIHFKVKQTQLVQLEYKQQMKKFGITVHDINQFIGDEFEPREEYVVYFDNQHSPLFVKGMFTCITSYYAEGELFFESPWKLNIS
ncbi:hypothetical protein METBISCDRAFT_25010 [Metschnikowia bicuspidata]|uniref:Uncharacterized protein n=1 Tax=Metschnikowia bicuspidata TaxID=27322 RepID=A0A4P9Z966_9ASCO|nr:hypothetical protein METBISCDRAFT_25010 [Metschnikowia bicuspidata]